MAVRKPEPRQTPKERQMQQHIKAIRKSYPRVDRFGAYRELCVELAEETGGDVESIWDEFVERSGTRMYLGEIEIEDAERLAMEDVRERFRAAS